jgi:N-acetylneuraminic acid mutarotase
VFGGCDSRACFNELYVLDVDSFHWSSPHVVGDVPVPLRAMTCTAVGKKLVVFGGGDGPAYYNDIYVLDTVNFRWHRPRLIGDKVPSARRAHTACLYKNGIYVFGGGDGVRALNDIWRLDVTDTNKMSWKLVSGPTTGSPNVENKPKARGYHTANMVGGKLIIYGGSDGGECFNDVWVYDVDTHVWKAVTIPITFRRLSHTATIVGSYLFVVGGHDGNEYSNDVLLLNLVTMTWDKRKVYGLPPSGRGYHGTILYDSRLVMIGGFDGGEVFSDVWLLELAVHAYYSQISHFTIEV